MLKSMKKKLNETKGFTLIEVIVVLVIIAILMAIAVPNVLGYINRAKGTEAQAQARSIYMAATAETAEILKNSDTMTASDFNTTHDKNVKDLANFSGTISYTSPAASGPATISATPPAANAAEVYVADNAIAGVLYTPSAGVGDPTDKENVVFYNGYTGNISVGTEITYNAAIPKTETSTSSSD